MPDLEQVPLTAELLSVMRRAARTAIDLKEPFISPRALLLALLDDPDVGPSISHVVVRQKVLDAEVGENTGMTRALEERMESGEQPAITRYDTLAFKTPDGRTSMWLNKDAYRIFIEGAQRVDDRYYPKHLALGLAAEAIQAPGVLAAIRVEPGVLADAIYRL
ncbi:MAG TPA: hypothetical protein VFH72_09670 [Candidatus Baltobacteraceae bacterium]|nr:hypothetical protein [Candidatus Baltobacteraceae bacterium]